MKMRNKGKGKVHPTPTPTPSSSTSKDVLAVFELLPAAIIVLVSLLSLQDKEVLAYMITRSLKTTIDSSNHQDKSKKNGSVLLHRPPMFDCECFDCYTSYWSKWNSSSNRELIHQAIEAFEEHLNINNGELSSSKSKNKNKKRVKMGQRGGENSEENGSKSQQFSPENQERGQESSLKNQECGKGSSLNGETMVVLEAAPPVSTAMVAGCGSTHKGLARKVLPDVLGFFSSRLWSLWGPNV